MTSNPHRSSEVEIAHVLYMDLVGYSVLLMEEQVACRRDLLLLVRGTGEFRRAEGRGELICSPSGDGMALVFFRDPEAPVQCALEIARSLPGYPRLKLRMGIHTGRSSGWRTSTRGRRLRRRDQPGAAGDGLRGRRPHPALQHRQPSC